MRTDAIPLKGDLMEVMANGFYYLLYGLRSSCGNYG